jgi:excinuclease UvrABC nuclease subunit
MELIEEKVHLWIDSARFVKSKPGVYILYDKKLDAIYIGESENLQSQFSKYLDDNFVGEPCKQKTHAYQRTFTANPKEKKKLLLDTFREKYGSLPPCNTDSDYSA